MSTNLRRGILLRKDRRGQNIFLKYTLYFARLICLRFLEGFISMVTNLPITYCFPWMNFRTDQNHNTIQYVESSMSDRTVVPTT